MPSFLNPIKTYRKSRLILHSQPIKLNPVQWDILYILFESIEPVGYYGLLNGSSLPFAQKSIYAALRTLITKNLVIESRSKRGRQWQITIAGMTAIKTLLKRSA